MNLNSQLDGEDWTPCKPGLIQASADASKAAGEQQAMAARRGFLKTLSLGGLAVAGTGIAGWSLLSNRNGGNGNPGFSSASMNNPGPIACSAVSTHLAQYVGEAIQDADLLKRIQFHLTICQSCARKRDQLASTASVSRAATASKSVQR